jgi:hypothetical protein
MTPEQLAEEMNIAIDTARLIFGDGTPETIARNKSTLEGLIRAGQSDLPNLPTGDLNPASAEDVQRTIRAKRLACGMHS